VMGKKIKKNDDDNSSFFFLFIVLLGTASPCAQQIAHHTLRMHTLHSI
jgi:hypothetical protein